MSIEFRLPELGENVSSATISKILVNAGDTVSANQIVLEVETDKAVAEIPCTVAGTVLEVRVATGQNVKAGAVILVLAEGRIAEQGTHQDLLEIDGWYNKLYTAGRLGGDGVWQPA